MNYNPLSGQENSSDGNSLRSAQTTKSESTIPGPLDRITKLESENEMLKEIIKQLRQEIQSWKENTLPATELKPPPDELKKNLSSSGEQPLQDNALPGKKKSPKSAQKEARTSGNAPGTLKKENRMLPQDNRKLPQDNRELPQDNRESAQEDRKSPQENRKFTQENRMLPQDNRESSQENRELLQENRKFLQEDRELLQENRKSTQENRELPQENRETPQENRKWPQEDRVLPQEDRKLSKENASGPDAIAKQNENNTLQVNNAPFQNETDVPEVNLREKNTFAGQDENTSQDNLAQMQIKGLKEYSSLIRRIPPGQRTKRQYVNMIAEIARKYPMVNLPGKDKYYKVNSSEAELRTEKLIDKLILILKSSLGKKYSSVTFPARAVKLLLHLNEVQLISRKDLIVKTGIAPASLDKIIKVFRKLGFVESLLNQNYHGYIITEKGKEFLSIS